jgi:hypothetical protein
LIAERTRGSQRFHSRLSHAVMVLAASVAASVSRLKARRHGLSVANNAADATVSSGCQAEIVLWSTVSIAPTITSSSSIATYSVLYPSNASNGA